MAGTWMSVVHGFRGLRVKNDTLVLNPYIHEDWSSYSFKIMFRGSLLCITINHEGVSIVNETSTPVKLEVSGKNYSLDGNATLTV